MNGGGFSQMAHIAGIGLIYEEEGSINDSAYIPECAHCRSWLSDLHALALLLQLLFL